MKRLLIAALFLITTKACFAQQTNNNYSNRDIIGFLKKAIRYPAQLRENCLMPFTYIKFKVNQII